MSPSLRTWTFLALLGLPLSLGRASADGVEEAQQAIIKLHENKQLFDKSKYKTVRAAFARLFEAKHQAAFIKAFGDDAEALQKWLDAHPDLQEDFFTALDERYDKIEAALTLFRDLWKKSPKLLEKHPDLGIAVAVTWDDRRGVYNYGGHQTRTKSKMPTGFLDGLANFEYAVGDKGVEARCRNLPWEFLIFVIDHPTPLAERAWAQGYFRANPGVKSWHQDVPYDHEMLKAEKTKGPSDLKPRLQDREYTLSNLRQFGGVCAQQADFAARVAKSVGVPAVYCSGDSAYRGGHAWWMYVQIQQASPSRIQFTLNSDGRFVGFIKDALYTGDVVDPHTGRRLLDRDLERRLYMTGNDPLGKRHSELLLRAYPWLQKQLGWDVRQRVAYLDKIMRICPWNDGPWLELAKSNQLQAEHKKVVRAHLATVMESFKSYPDFIQRIYSDLLKVYEPAEQVKLYQQAVALFERSNRPDLSCDARLDITEALIQQKKWQPAAEGLIATIYRFPTEGRYVPKLIAKAQEVCAQYKGGNERLAQIYLDIVPKLAVYYRNEEVRYPDEMYLQAIDFFERNRMSNRAALLRARMGRK